MDKSRKSMFALILDTSTDHLHLGLLHHNTWIAKERVAHEQRLSHFLITSIDTFLQTHSVSRNALSYIACGTGPGSFTGTRIGAIVAMSLSFALDIPSLGFPSSLIFEETSALLDFLKEKLEKKSYSLDVRYK